MGEDTPFGGIVVAGVTMLIGTKLLVGSMIELLSVSGGTVQLLLGSEAVTAVVGVCLLLATGALLTRLWWGRAFAIVVLAVVGVLGRPAMGDIDLIAVVQTVVVAVTILYLLVNDPAAEERRSDIDESTSASRVGSTIR